MFNDIVLTTYGQHQAFNQTASPTSCEPDDLVFVFESAVAPDKAAVIVTSQQVAEQIKDGCSAFIVVVEDVRLAQAIIKRHFDDYKAHDMEWDAIHVSAVVHATAKLGDGCRVGPNAVIGANCVFADNVTIRAGAVIEHAVVIGAGSIINANVNIGYNSQLGQRVVVQAGAAIGSEGYGFAVDKLNHYHRVPHTGRVVLGDDVQVGANSCIDRGTYGDTAIAAGVKIDNLVHIAHNVEVGEDTMLTAQTVIAGSSKIGKRVIASGQTGVLDHKSVADDAILVHRCGVTEDITSGGMWAGSPAKPFKEFVRGLALHKKVAKLELQIKELKKQLSN
ncbi:MAG: UDP-3-O-[3-hydroxymyristoyl] glucosamine N-acyltransferase [Arenicella sp.]|jgi:UDP-3-O-[3-hydroxymyristoyl] glucosamine N-acyltransferase